MHIFIVDDDRDFAESLQEVLVDNGHRVTLAHSGEEAIKLIPDFDFDLALLDIRLPGMNGVESMMQIKQHRPDANVMMMTAFSVEQLLEEAIDEGALGVLHKPIHMDHLLETIENVKPSGVVMLVDDDPDFSDSISNSLTAHNFCVKLAKTGEEALLLADRNTIDLIILDLRLPVLSGLETYMELKHRGHHVPTIIVTGYLDDEREQLDALLKDNVSYYLQKPFDMDVLIKLLSQYITQRELTDH